MPGEERPIFAGGLFDGIYGNSQLVASADKKDDRNITRGYVEPFIMQLLEITLKIVKLPYFVPAIYALPV